MSKLTMTGFLSIVLAVGFFGALWMLFSGRAPADSLRDVFLVMIGTLGAEFGAMCKFWWGTTQGSARKDELLANSMPMAGRDK
jgi:membrane protein DedA with SNARE-associated domain